jgi:ATP-dependent DNA helicase PIF1
MNQGLALEIMLSGQSVLLTGPAGAGKTFVLNQFIKLAKYEGKHVSVTATLITWQNHAAKLLKKQMC